MGWADELKKELDWGFKKMSALEMRAMEDNMQGHEFVRMLMSMVSGYDERGDPTWLLRQVMTSALHYMRTLTRTYTHMAPDEKMGLLRLAVFEALQRHWRSVR